MSRKSRAIAIARARSVRNPQEMTSPAPPGPFTPLKPGWALLLVLLAGAAYWVAFSVPAGAPAALVAVPCVCLLARMRTSRQAFYTGLAAGILMYVPHLSFFASIFGWKAILLWLIAGFPVGAFVLLLNLARRRLGPDGAAWLTPVLWTG